MAGIPLDRLPEALESARRTYTGNARASDAARLAVAMPGFVALVREHVTDPDRADDALPRWSFGATALELGRPLASLNVRHFPMFPRLKPPC